MIIVITYKEKDARGRSVQMVSHGVDTETLKNVVLPQIPLSEIGAIRDPETNEYILK